jgi:hypothetical protein
MFWVGNFLRRWVGDGFVSYVEKGVGIMNETTQSFDKPLERHCQNNLALIAQENGYDQPHERTHSSHPLQIHPKSQMMKRRTL